MTETSRPAVARMASAADAPGVAVIRIDRPPVNALPPSDWVALTSLVQAVGDEHDVRALVIAGVPGAFCAGADIRILTNPSPDDPPAMMLTTVADTCRAIRSIRVPVIAAIDGPAHGGGLELALACDIRVSSSAATFAASGVNMGLVASVRSLVEIVGQSRARRMLLTGQRIEAEQAERWGIVTDLVDDPMATALELAHVMASKAPLAVEAAKRMAAAVDQADAGAHDELMIDEFSTLAASADHAEAIRAFLAKDRPTFNRS